jgi:hypothetical protein
MLLLHPASMLQVLPQRAAAIATQMLMLWPQMKTTSLTPRGSSSSSASPCLAQQQQQQLGRHQQPRHQLVLQQQALQ